MGAGCAWNCNRHLSALPALHPRIIMIHLKLSDLKKSKTTVLLFLGLFIGLFLVAYMSGWGLHSILCQAH